MPTVYSALKIDLKEVKCCRIGNKEKQDAPIKVRFGSISDKEQFMQANMEIKIALEKLGLGSYKKLLYLNHDLTKQNQYLYKLARKFKKENDYQYVWFSNRSIMVRKNDSSKIQIVETENDLKNLQRLIPNETG
ncbi:hypothetical protein JTB14_001021 [Gonioctena quinquepunctata]|nr:hypothetical protein JTB14_001021 [Gonioctena quinquepunctata]